MIIEATLENMKEDYSDWYHVLEVAFRDSRNVINNNDVLTEPFTFDDIDKILGSSNGENDGLDWIAVFYLRDGRYAYIQSGCDYTGWG